MKTTAFKAHPVYLSAVLTLVCWIGFPSEATALPEFEKLLELNAAQLFGGEVRLLGDDRFEVSFSADGQVTRGFDGKGILDASLVTGSDKKFITKKKKKGGRGGGGGGAGGGAPGGGAPGGAPGGGADRGGGAGRGRGEGGEVYPGLACLGISEKSGAWTAWTSRFPVRGDVRVSFNLRLPGLVNSQSGFICQLNAEKKTSLQTTFFSTAEFLSGGRVKARQVSRDKTYASHAMKWFPRNREEGVPVELSAIDGKFTVKVDDAEIVSLNKYPEMDGGKIVFGFRKLVICLHYLKISGKLDREWCEERLKFLEKSGKLITTDGGVAGSGGPPTVEDKKKTAEDDL